MNICVNLYSHDRADHSPCYLTTIVVPVVKTIRCRVRSRFASECRPFLLRRKWHPSQELTELGDGRFELAFQVKGILGIRPWLYRWLPDVEVLVPLELAHMVEEELARALERQREVNKGG